MNHRSQTTLLIILTPAFLLVFTIIHESGHTLLARLFGDPASTFYLVKIDEQGTCLGCNITDHNKTLQRIQGRNELLMGEIRCIP